MISGNMQHIILQQNAQARHTAFPHNTSVTWTQMANKPNRVTRESEICFQTDLLVGSSLMALSLEHSNYNKILY